MDFMGITLPGPEQTELFVPVLSRRRFETVQRDGLDYLTNSGLKQKYLAGKFRSYHMDDLDPAQRLTQAKFSKEISRKS